MHVNKKSINERIVANYLSLRFCYSKNIHLILNDSILNTVLLFSKNSFIEVLAMYLVLIAADPDDTIP